ncbi:nose resistant to fluoxetine protein 6-like [Drosophila novamexicana]|uniref:nose resistant to fluoxetine protein 6-like n=1 Tax=Drosophila novamexicana TaxID=47314 RepID=UPI0011E5DE9B|nr:nose resistant to fluoxetine protein 6-like [Drosophila novamexicana]
MYKIGFTLLLCVLAGAGAQFLDIDRYQQLLQLRPLAVEFIDYYRNITSGDLLIPGTGLPNQQDLRCLAEVATLSQGVQTGSIWALRMIDSWGRLPAGILYGNRKDLGNFDECIRVNQLVASTGHSLRGKYCMAKLLSGNMLGGNAGALGMLSVQTAICLPASCTSEHMETLLRQLFKQLLNIELSTETQLINAANCQTAERESLDGLAIFTIVLMCVLVAALLLATLYDYFLCADQKHLPALVKVFSARANSRTLFRIVDSKTNPNVIDCLHGIRCLSLIWVIYGHDYILQGISPNINLVDVIPWYRSPFSMFIMHGLFSVDTFFFLSGLLVVMVALRSMERTKGKLNVPLMYLHRYLRLTPVVALAILCYMRILPLLGAGPLYKGLVAQLSAPCEDNWFWTLLYVQNYATNTVCLPHSWYLGVDMQLYIFSPLFLIALYKWGKKAIAGIVVLLLLLAACLFSMMVVKGYSLSTGGMSDEIYFTTHTRASPWIIGLIFGYYLHVNRSKTFKLNRLTVWLGWLISLGLIFTSLFALYPYPANGNHLPIVNEAFYVTLTRIAWPLALVWLVFACKYGYGGLANSFLSSPLWQPLSKLSYGAYIWHILIAMLNAGITRTSTYFSDYQVMLRFWHDFGFTILLAYFMFLLVEAPFGGLEMLLLPTRAPRSQPPPAAKSSPIAEPEPSSIEIAPALEPKTAPVN